MGADHRRQHRIAVALEVRIRGVDRAGLAFEETIHSDNISRGGCSLDVSRELDLGAELDIEILRRVPGRRDPVSFLTRGVVVRSAPTGPAGEDRYLIGIQFTGPHFPTYASEDTASEGS
jgi:hypothetical protein